LGCGGMGPPASFWLLTQSNGHRMRVAEFKKRHALPQEKVGIGLCHWSPLTRLCHSLRVTISTFLPPKATKAQSIANVLTTMVLSKTFKGRLKVSYFGNSDIA
jgi:hypothetical protein